MHFVCACVIMTVVTCFSFSFVSRHHTPKNEKHSNNYHFTVWSPVSSNNNPSKLAKNYYHNVRFIFIYIQWNFLTIPQIGTLSWSFDRFIGNVGSVKWWNIPFTFLLPFFSSRDDGRRRWSRNVMNHYIDSNTLLCCCFWKVSWRQSHWHNASEGENTKLAENKSPVDRSISKGKMGKFFIPLRQYHLLLESVFIERHAHYAIIDNHSTRK